MCHRNMIKHVIKRDGVTQVEYDRNKIRIAIEKANTSVETSQRIGSDEINGIIEAVEADSSTEGITVEEIQDKIENRLMLMGYYDLAKNYITYRYKRKLIRQKNTTDDSILSLLHGENKEVQEENSNKKAVINSTQRDLIAGETSKDISKRVLLPDYIVDAHEKGIIHFHDMDYFMQPEFNCCLPNFRDMFENGTTIHGVMIEPPKSFRVACTQLTQAMADISSNQYGGQTCYVDVLGRFLALTKDKFEKRIRKRVEKRCHAMTEDDREQLIKEMVDEELEIELKAGIQSIQYQINTLMTTNGQAPFVTLFMYLKDDDPYLEENAMIFEEILKQRYKGFKNKQGVPVTPAFPKLVYVVGKNNCLQGGKYDYLTHLAAKCTAKRMYPDYISEKVMMENYDGEVFGCMGCVDGKEMIKYRYMNGEPEYHTFEEFWNQMCALYTVKKQSKDSDNLFIDTPNGALEVWDTKEGWVTNRRIIRNVSTDWVQIILDNGMVFHCTEDHPLMTTKRGVVTADKLTERDRIYYTDPKHGLDPESGFDNEIEVKIKSIRRYKQNKYSYDVTTLSNHFEVSGIYSHNCRSFLSAYRDPKSGEIQWEGRLTTKVKSTLNSVNVRKNGVLVA